MKKITLQTLTLILVITFSCGLLSCRKSRLNKAFCDCSTSPTEVVVDTFTLSIPNIITPNNDGINDTWQITNIEHFPDCHVKVTKDGGSEKTVFESTGYAHDWDGNVKEGKYNYEITIGNKVFSGSVCVYLGSINGAKGNDIYDCLKNCTPSDTADPILKVE